MRPVKSLKAASVKSLAANKPLEEVLLACNTLNQDVCFGSDDRVIELLDETVGHNITKMAVLCRLDIGLSQLKDLCDDVSHGFAHGLGIIHGNYVPSCNPDIIIYGPLIPPNSRIMNVTTFQERQTFIFNPDKYDPYFLVNYLNHSLEAYNVITGKPLGEVFRIHT